MTRAGAWVKGPPGSLSVGACGGRMLGQVADTLDASALTSGPRKAVCVPAALLGRVGALSGPLRSRLSLWGAEDTPARASLSPACVQNWPLWEALMCVPGPRLGRPHGFLAVGTWAHTGKDLGIPHPETGDPSEGAWATRGTKGVLGPPPAKGRSREGVWPLSEPPPPSPNSWPWAR